MKKTALKEFIEYASIPGADRGKNDCGFSIKSLLEKEKVQIMAAYVAGMSNMKAIAVDKKEPYGSAEEYFTSQYGE